MDFKSVIVLVSVVVCCFAARPEVVYSCREGFFFNLETMECTPCSTCQDNEVIRRKCYANHDTSCGPLSQFQFIRTNEAPKSADIKHSQIAGNTKVPTTSMDFVTENDDKWFTITMVLVGILVVTCVAGVITVLVTCVVCRRKEREIICEPGKFLF